MIKYEGRKMDLKNRVNEHLAKLTGIERDYFSNLTQIDLLELKKVLSDINNLLTFQMTIVSANWLCHFFKLDETTRLETIEKVDNTKPNTKGFDIHITAPYKIIAEVKCIVPVNNGGIFGAAQHDAIMDDIHKLIHGKGNLTDTSKYFKFLFLIDLGEKTNQAVTELIRGTKGTSLKANKYNELKKDKISQVTGNAIFNEIDTNRVYLKKIEIK